MTIGATTRAAVVGTGVTNEPFLPAANNVPRKIVIVGTFDPLKTEAPIETPTFVTSPADVANRFGQGFMLHRLALANDVGAQGLETWVVAQEETVASAASTGTITYVVGTIVAGILHLYVAGVYVPVMLTAGLDATAIGDAVVAAVTAKPDLPVTASNAAGVVTFTSKSTGPWGDGIDLDHNLGQNQAFPSGFTSATVVAMTGGSGVPDIDDALNALGTDDSANESHFTALVNGYGNASGVLDKIHIYNGVDQDFTGCYAKNVARPFRSLYGDTAAGSAGYNALVTIADARTTDRTNGVVPAPGSPNHPEEIAAQALGVMERIAHTRPEESYIGKNLTGVIPGPVADRWTSDHDVRDAAVQKGISTTLTKSKTILTLQNICTFYHPATLPISSNAFISQRNIAVIQNVLNAYNVYWKTTPWQGITIVEDVTKVTDNQSLEKVRDVDSVLDAMTLLARAFAGKAWFYNSSYTIDNMTVQVRPGGLGFDTKFPAFLSGEAGIYNGLIPLDTNFTVLTQ